jgi:prepilin-type N-terminal cleavage/methylation domain-containing protein
MINTHSVLGSYRSQPARRRFSLTSGCNHHSRRGLSLIEVMLAIVITSVIAIGTLGYQYFSIKHSRASDAQYLATRIGQLLLEDWKSTGGADDYDPESLQLGFESPENDEFGDYMINLGNIPFFVQLQFDDVDQDDAADVTLRQISVTVRWRRDYTRGALTGADPFLTLTTYVRRDES